MEAINTLIAFQFFWVMLSRIIVYLQIAAEIKLNIQI